MRSHLMALTWLVLLSACGARAVQPAANASGTHEGGVAHIDES